MELQLSNKHKIFLNNLDKFMKHKNVNDKCLQDDIGISSSTISKWRSRGSFPSIDKLLKMAEYFEVSLNDFFMDELSFNNDSNINLTEKNKIIKYTTRSNSLINTPLNKFVAWKFADEYPFDADRIKHIIHDFDLKHIEGYVFKDKNIDYFLVCRFKNNPLESSRSLYHFEFNKAFPPKLISADEDIMGEIFDYCHEQNLDVAGNYFFAQNSR